MFKTIKTRLYDGPLTRGPKFHYVTTLNGTQVSTGATKEESIANAAKTLLGAYDCQTSAICASAANDGAILTTREYAPGEVEQAFHRTDTGRNSGISMGRCEIAGARCSVIEYHFHRLTQYNETMAPVMEVTS